MCSVIKKKSICLIILAIVLVVVGCVYVLISEPESLSRRYINKATAARMLVLLESSGLNSDEGEDPALWYQKYIYYLGENDKISWDEDTADEDAAYQAFTYGELKEYLNALGMDIEEIEESTDIKIEKQKNGSSVRKNDFYKIYDYLVYKLGNSCGVVRKELTIVGTPGCMSGEQIEAYGVWNCIALEGIYSFEGLSLDRYADKVISVYAKGNNIISVLAQVTDEVCYQNVWLVSGAENSLRIFVEGVYREYGVKKIDGIISDVISDVTIKEGKVTGLTIKEDTITGKVLKISNDTLVLEKYGSIPIDEGFNVYKNYGVLEMNTINDILVGYELSDFVVANGKVCAAVINKELVAEDIRVLIMDTGYQSVFHDRVTITADVPFTVDNGLKVYNYEANELVDIYPGSDYMQEGRCVITASGINNAVKLLSVERSYGNPYYYGEIEIAGEQDKLLIINELPLENYLNYVVPSEMPVRFGVEALKVQAVCARSYAYKQLVSNAYRMYGAHVDDSVNFQVYNNIEAQPDSTQAVKETYGEVISRGDEVIAAYYFSTSCGYLSDVSLWGSEPSNYPMYVSKTANPLGKVIDLSDENTFYNFISNKDETDYDYEFSFYRWNVALGLEYLQGRINEYLPQRYALDAGAVLTKNEEGRFVSKTVGDIGELESIEVVERANSGAIKQLLIRGSKSEVLVSGELNIRYLLGPGENLITTNTGETTTFYILPSAYVYMEEIYDGDKLIGYNMLGGGYGHGIGMSQNAVSAMVKNGMKYDEILRFFYEGISIENIYVEE